MSNSNVNNRVIYTGKLRKGTIIKIIGIAAYNTSLFRVGFYATDPALEESIIGLQLDNYKNIYNTSVGVETKAYIQVPYDGYFFIYRLTTWWSSFDVSVYDSNANVIEENEQDISHFKSLLLNEKIEGKALNRNGELFSTTQESYSVSEYLLLSKGNVRVNNCYQGTSATAICLYDENKNFLASYPTTTSSQGQNITIKYDDLLGINPNVVYMRCTFKDAGDVDFGVVNNSAQKGYDVESAVINVHKALSGTETPAYLDKNGKVQAADTYNLSVSGFYKLNGDTLIIHNVFYSTDTIPVCFYDANKNYIGSYTLSVKGVSDVRIEYANIMSLYNDAAYIRCSLATEGYIVSGANLVIAEDFQSVCDNLGFVTSGKNVGVFVNGAALIKPDADGNEITTTDVSANWCVSSLIELTHENIMLYGSGQGKRAEPIHFYDSMMRYCGSLKYDTSGYHESEQITADEIPCEAKYARFTFITSLGYWDAIGGVKRIDWKDIDTIIKRLPSPVTYDIQHFKDGYIVHYDGTLQYKSTWEGAYGVYRMYKLTGEDISIKRAYHGINARAVVYYDKFFDVCGVYEAAQSGVQNITIPSESIPSNAVYFRGVVNTEGNWCVNSGGKDLTGEDYDAYILHITRSSNNTNNNIIQANDMYGTSLDFKNITRASRKQNVAKTKPLILLHFSDIHADATNLARIVEWRDFYSDNIDDTICTGDIVNAYYADDFTFWTSVQGTENILLSTGNHDCRIGDDWSGATEQETYNKYFSNNISKWGVDYTPGVCYYTKEYTNEKVLLIVVDCMHVNDAQKTWFAAKLSYAKTNGLHVIVAQHFHVYRAEGTGYNFDTLQERVFWNDDASWDLIEDLVIKVDTFITGGGKFIAWIAGHTHEDYFIIRNGNQVCVNVSCASSETSKTDYCDTDRTAGTKNQDLFNIFAVDTYAGKFKITRIGADKDIFMRQRKYLSYDYINMKLLWEG